MKRGYSIWIYWCIALLAVGIYLLFSGTMGVTGYPLDDAWIHQTFARNLIEHGEWAVNPGEITAGSTSPLWTVLIAIGYLLKYSSLFVDIWHWNHPFGCQPLVDYNLGNDGPTGRESHKVEILPGCFDNRRRMAPHLVSSLRNGNPALYNLCFRVFV